MQKVRTPSVISLKKCMHHLGLFCLLSGQAASSVFLYFHCGKGVGSRQEGGGGRWRNEKRWSEEVR